MIEKILIVLILLISTVASHAQMVLEYDISSDNNIISLPLSGSVNVSVDWGDGSPLPIYTTASDKEHIYTSSGTKTVTITGSLSHFGSNTSPLENNRLSKVKKLGWIGAYKFTVCFFI